MSYYNKNDEHKYKFVIWVAICCAVFLLITIAVVVCSIYVFNKKHDDDSANKISNSRVVESMFSSMPQSSMQANNAASEAASRQEVVSSASASSSAYSSASASSSQEASASSSSSSQAPTSVTPAENAYVLNYNPASLSVNLPVDCILQIPDLPQGCEVTSLAIAMKYKGFGSGIDNLKCYLADNYLPKTGSTSYNDAQNYFLGDPRSDFPGGLYCFEGAITKTIEAYNDSHPDDEVLYLDLTDVSAEDLYSMVEIDVPIIVWVTTDWKDPDFNGSYYQNLHCVVLTGYSDSVVKIADPMRGNVYIARDRFEYVWKAMGCRAIAIDTF